jgi:hypothetical protein
VKPRRPGVEPTVDPALARIAGGQPAEPTAEADRRPIEKQGPQQRPFQLGMSAMRTAGGKKIAKHWYETAGIMMAGAVDDMSSTLEPGTDNIPPAPKHKQVGV